MAGKPKVMDKRQQFKDDFKFYARNCLHIKPKNMHQKTFDRLRAAESQAQDAMNSAFLARYGYWL
jgi:hypothetical protein